MAYSLWEIEKLMMGPVAWAASAASILANLALLLVFFCRAERNCAALANVYAILIVVVGCLTALMEQGEYFKRYLK